MQTGEKTNGKRLLRTRCADKVSDRFPVVGELFRRHPEIADRLPGTAVNRAFTILTDGTKRKGRVEDVRKGTFPCRCLYVVCDSSSYTVTTPSCFRYTHFAIFLFASTHRVSFYDNFLYMYFNWRVFLFHRRGLVKSLRYCLLIIFCRQPKQKGNSF